MKKLLFIFIVIVTISSCATTKDIEERSTITIGNETSIPISFLVTASAFKDILSININGQEKFQFIFTISTAAKTLEETINYNGNSVRAACKLDLSSKKTTASYTAHNCSIFVDEKLAIQYEV